MLCTEAFAKDESLLHHSFLIFLVLFFFCWHVLILKAFEKFILCMQQQQVWETHSCFLNRPTEAFAKDTICLIFNTSCDPKSSNSCLERQACFNSSSKLALFSFDRTWSFVGAYADSWFSILCLEWFRRGCPGVAPPPRNVFPCSSNCFYVV